MAVGRGSRPAECVGFFKCQIKVHLHSRGCVSVLWLCLCQSRVVVGEVPLPPKERKGVRPKSHSFLSLVQQRGDAGVFFNFAPLLA